MYGQDGLGALMAVYWVFVVAVLIVMVVCLWKVFIKAGQPGWAALIPIYNTYLMIKIAGKPGWWLILQFIPLVNIVVSILVCIGLSANFGKDSGFAIGLILLPFIFLPVLAFGSARYQPQTP